MPQSQGQCACLPARNDCSYLRPPLKNQKSILIICQPLLTYLLFSNFS